MDYFPTIVTAVLVFVGLATARWYLFSRAPKPTKEARLPRHLAMAGLILLGLAAIILALPVSDEVELQILGIFGIIVSGGIALSSNNIFENAMAGLMLRLNQPFKTGDHIRVGDHAGRVTERGLFDTEIQTSAHELVSLPNAYLTSEPITVVSSRGALVSVSIPLDNETHFSIVEDSLIKAARDTELLEPFTQVLEISDEAITYQVSGMIDDDSRLLTVRSALNRAILERLDESDIELVGPMPLEITRARPGDVKSRRRLVATPDVDIDKIIFDKAEQVEAREGLVEEIENLQENAEELNISPEAAQDLVERKLDELERLDEALLAGESTPTSEPGSL